MPGHFSLTAHLNRLINFLLILASLATGCGMLLIVNQAYEESASLQVTLAQLPIYEQSLRLVEAVSAERGPTNAMLGEREGDPQQLARARALSDERQLKLQEMLRTCPDCSVTAAQLEKAYRRVLHARMLLDTRLQQPPGTPDRVGVEEVVDAMFRAADENFIAANRILYDLTSRTSDIAICLSNAKLAARLRDTAGRLGSLLTPALENGRVPTPEEQIRLQQMTGRLHQLVDLLRSNLDLTPTVDERARFLSVQKSYLDNGLDVYHRTLAGLARGERPSAAAFARNYVPTMASILELRDTALELARGEAERLAQEASRRLLLTIVAACGILLALVAGLLLLKLRLLSPLLANTQRLLALTRRHIPENVQKNADPRTLFAAFERLEYQLHQVDLLRQERDALIAELKVRADTDHLTGLANRRAFERLLTKGVLMTPRYLAAITFDIDHFKRINDTFGHAAGDLLLQRLAQRCGHLVREGDRIARIGGEEFAVLADVTCPEEAARLAERLRQGIADTPFDIGTDTLQTMTASFGVSVTARLEPGAKIRLLADADAALYRAKHRGRNCSEVAEPSSTYADQPCPEPSSSQSVA